MESGLTQTYLDKPLFNHPPLMGGYLYLTELVGEWVSFSLAIRLPAILADIGTAVLIYSLLVRYADRRRAELSACLVALSPVLIPVSGFHGNTDPVFIFLVLLSAHSLLVRERVLEAGIWLGLALNVKIVPVLTLPAFFLWLPDWRCRIWFALGVVLLLVLGFAYPLVQIPEVLLRNVFLYSSYPGYWGFSLLGKWVAVWNDGWTTGFKWSALAAVAWSSARVVWMVPARSEPDGARLLLTLGSVYAVFLVLSPGFGPQYLAWLTLAALVGWNGFAVLSALSGIYILSLYTYWCSGVPWDYADPTRHHPAITALSLLPWGFLFAWMAWLLGWGGGPRGRLGDP